MKIVAAYLLAVLGGNNSPSVDHIKAILGSVGVEVEDDRIELLLSQVKGTDLAEIVACGREKMASIPCAGAAIAVGAPTAAGGAAPAVASVAAEPEKKEDKKEVVEESDEDMCFSLFD
ncbi:60S acidic ribosomal protein P2A-like [Momordica charantia]|uniref:60S acidic ribosomal protein P2A-like n=1 Tax=Momordica charantia TaxID=3673 RepID=A0A6J1CQB9_MOMCH|nr:60S acidic ribosomal protein P2A-like [Momordica charantia]XP_022143773.1 60S acidic ribosomal protein P2A-like [Momordica charantia]XP_022143774.1 60S acidic ribosomal protein P2A-like [Momordica charantia]